MLAVALSACGSSTPSYSVTSFSHRGAVSTASSYSLLYSFVGPPKDGWVSADALARNSGVLYGLTSYGGPRSKKCTNGCGTFFSFDPSSSRETVIYSFQGAPNDAFLPNSNLEYFDGSFYGASWGGGTSNLGTIFEFKQRNGKWKEHVLYSFQGPPNDGHEPLGVNIDAHGRIFGATLFGGSETTCFFKADGCGTIFELDPPATGSGQWRERILYNFPGAPDGAAPHASLILAADGTIYGETGYGGSSTACPYLGGCGTIFQLRAHASRWSERVLHSFNVPGGKPRNDGSIPDGLYAGAKGVLYGTTEYGGGYGSNVCNVEKGLSGCGTLFRFNQRGRRWVESILYAFKGAPDDGAEPDGITPDGKGGFYGESAGGGSGPCQAYTGCGALFDLTPRRDGTWTATMLHSFEGFPTDGEGPGRALVPYGGSFYGRTAYGGSGPCDFGCGTIYALTP